MMILKCGIKPQCCTIYYNVSIVIVVKCVVFFILYKVSLYTVGWAANSPRGIARDLIITHSSIVFNVCDIILNKSDTWFIVELLCSRKFFEDKDNG